MAPAAPITNSFSADEKQARLSEAAGQRFARKAAASLMRSSWSKHPEMA